ncbi:MAG: HEAT repeat domain-containing protein [Planctomycetota bacterium]|jgi:hypothetical protein
MELEYYIVILVIVLVLGGIVVGVVYNFSANEDIPVVMSLPERFRIVPYACLENGFEVYGNQYKLLQTPAFEKLANAIRGLAKIERVIEPEAPGSEQPPKPEIEKFRAEIGGMGYFVCEMLPVLAKSVYDDPSTNANDFRTRDMPNRWREWIAVVFGIAGKECGKWFLNSLERAPASSEDKDTPAGALAARLIALSLKPLPAHPLDIPEQYRNLAVEISKMPAESVKKAFAIAYAVEPRCRPWLAVIARWYVGAELLKTASAWMDGDGFPGPDVRVTRALIRAMAKIPGGGEKLLELYGKLRNPIEKNSILYALARARYSPALGMFKELASGQVAGNAPKPNVSEQTVALRALSFFGSSDAAELSMSVFRNEAVPMTVRRWALEPYGAILKDGAFDELAKIFHEGDTEAKIAAIKGFERVRSEKAKAFLDEIALFDANTGVGGEARRAASQLQRHLDRQKSGK